MATDQQAPRRHIIGYALAPKKQSSFILPSLVSLARFRGIDLIPIIPTLPLTSQGPFAAIIHKLSGPAWDSALLAFSAAHPSVPIIDPPAAIARVHDRSTMLQAVSDLHHPSVTVPRQIIVLDSTALTHPPAALCFPVIAKPLSANGSDGSHKMSLIFRPDALAHLTPPLVLQEFVNHGGVIFKVYVVGEFVCCVKRKSLPDVSEDGMGAGELTFSQISNVATDTGRPAEEYIENIETREALASQNLKMCRWREKYHRRCNASYGENHFQVERHHPDYYLSPVERPRADYYLSPVSHEDKNTTIIYNDIELKYAYNYTDIARKANYNNSHSDVISSTGSNY